MTKVSSQAQTDKVSRAIRQSRKKGFTPTWKKRLSTSKLKHYENKTNRKLQSIRMKKAWRTNPILLLKKKLASEKRNLIQTSCIRNMYSYKNNCSKLRERLKKVYGNICWYCGLSLKGLQSHVDHIVPLVKGGTHHFENRALTCPYCNLAKHGWSLKELLKWFRHIRSSRFKTLYKFEKIHRRKNTIKK